MIGTVLKPCTESFLTHYQFFISTRRLINFFNYCHGVGLCLGFQYIIFQHPFINLLIVNRIIKFDYGSNVKRIWCQANGWNLESSDALLLATIIEILYWMISELIVFVVIFFLCPLFGWLSDLSAATESVCEFDAVVVHLLPLIDRLNQFLLVVKIEFAQS